VTDDPAEAVETVIDCNARRRAHVGVAAAREDAQ
jgi:hypothetical protein